MNEIVGYAFISKNAKIISNAPADTFQGKRLRVLEFGHDGDTGALVVNDEASGLAMIEGEDIISSFRCSQEGDVICPPDLDLFAKMSYVMMAMNRKGGYNWMVREIVISASLHSKKFNDNVLWAKQ